MRTSYFFTRRRTYSLSGSMASGISKRTVCRSLQISSLHVSVYTAPVGGERDRRGD
jgi:hypothetical protein